MQAGLGNNMITQVARYTIFIYVYTYIDTHTHIYIYIVYCFLVLYLAPAPIVTRTNRAMPFPKTKDQTNKVRPYQLITIDNPYKWPKIKWVTVVKFHPTYSSEITP